MTQGQEIIRFMKENGSISSYEAFAHLGITQLASRFCSLKAKGWEFSKERHYTKNRYGRSTYYDEYRILKEGEQI